MNRAKISVSLPDSLKEQLDQYAAQHELNTSEVVQHALKKLFEEDSPPPPPPTPIPPPEQVQPPFDLKTLRDYVTAMAMHQENIRRGMLAARLPCPPPLIPPPWWHACHPTVGWPPPPL